MTEVKSYGASADVALKTWVKLARAFSSFYKGSVDNIRKFNLTQPQFSVVDVLGHLGQLKIGQLCNKMLVSGGNMTLVLDNLEKIDLIERVHSKEDRRAIYVQLTQKGREVFEEIFPQHAKFIESQMSSLSIEEQKQLGDLLKKLGRSLDNKK